MTGPFYSHVGSRLRAARIEAGMNQFDVAEISGLNQPKISRIEVSGVVALDLLLYLVSLYHVRRDWLFFGEGDMK